jgi:hypothetical protein
MNLRVTPKAVLLLLPAAGVLLLAGVAGACAVAREPQGKPVEIADESAIIIWDEAGKTQHFIRRASFKTQASNFGFLVPTPTKPKLAEAGDEAFATLAEITKPEVITKTRSRGISCTCGTKAERDVASGNAQPAVRVLEENRLPGLGLDYAILEADKADALSKWLKEHGYDFSPDLKDWVAPYVKAGWKISAFKIAPGARDAQEDNRDKKNVPDPNRVATKALRMSFQTEQPFFPYREPASQADDTGHPRRLLRVYFLAKNRVKGTLGKKGDAWPGEVAWAGEVSGSDREKVLKLVKLPTDTGPASWWLTEFEDHSSPRPGKADVYFSRSEDQGTLKREPHIRYVSSAVPGCVMCYALAAYMLVPCLVRHWRRSGR